MEPELAVKGGRSSAVSAPIGRVCFLAFFVTLAGEVIVLFSKSTHESERGNFAPPLTGEYQQLHDRTKVPAELFRSGPHRFQFLV